MRKLPLLIGAAALAAALVFSGTAWALDLSDILEGIWPFDDGADPTESDGLEGYWPFDDGAYPTEDASVNNNTGDLHGTADFQGGSDIAPTFGNVDALDADGDNGLVSIGDPSELEFTSGDLTITAWVKPSATATIDHIFTRRKSGCGEIGYQVQMGGSNELTFSDGTGQRFSGLTVSDGVWSLIAVVFDDTANQVDFYVNGSTSLNVAAADLGSPGGTVDVQIGQANGCGAATHFDGLIDEVRIYNRALSIAEIEIKDSQ